MLLILQNVSPRVFVANLDHSSLRSEGGKHGWKTMTVTTVEHMPDGKLYPKRHVKPVPHSITLLAGEKSEPLPSSAKHSTEIANALRVGTLKIFKEWDDADQAPTAPAPTGGGDKIVGEKSGAEKSKKTTKET
jgi:hypothetical protein